MRVLIDAVPVDIIYSTVPISNGQLQLKDFLIEVLTEGYDRVKLSVLTQQFGFHSPGPILSRLNHLIDRGHLQIVPDSCLLGRSPTVE